MNYSGGGGNSNIANSLKLTKSNSASIPFAFQPKKLVKEKTIKTGYENPIRPTAITYLEGLNYFATAYKREITLFSIPEYEKKHSKKKVHSEDIWHLAFSPQKKTLFSLANDDYLYIHLVNKKGFAGLYRRIWMGFGNSMIGLLIKEDKNIMIGCGKGRFIQIWSLKDFREEARIKTLNGVEEREIGPHMAYSKREGLLAAFYPNTAKIGVFCMRRRKAFSSF